MEIMRNSKLSLKLGIIGAAFVLPLAVLLYLSIDNINGQIRFSRLETYGNAYQRPLEKLLEDLPRYPDDPAAVRPRIEAALTALAEVDARYGQDLQFTEEGLRIRDRSHLALAKVKDRWRALTGLSGDKAAMAEKATGLVADVMGMIAHAGDTSNLILDPDLDSYYLMDLTLLALPQTQRRLAEVMAFGQGVLGGGAIEEKDRRTLHSLAAILKDSDLGRIEGSTKTSLNEDQNFYGQSPTLAQNLTPALKRYVETNTAFIELLEKTADAETAPAAPAEFARIGQAARDAAFRYWEVCAGELDLLLATRIAHYERQRLVMLVATAGALILACLLAVWIGRGLTRSINDMVGFANKVSRGDLDAILPDSGATRELRVLGADLGTMVATLREKLGFVQGILDGVTMPCVVAGPDGRITYLNSLLCHFLSKPDSAASYIGTPLREFFIGNEEIASFIEKTLNESRMVTNQGYEGVDQRGQRFYIKLDASPIYDLDRKPLGVFAQFAILTEVKRQEEDLLARNRVIAASAARAVDIAARVTAAAEDLSAVVAETSHGAEQQRRRASETATAMEQMTATVLEVAKNASGAAEQAELTMRKAHEGEETVDRSVKAIAKVKEQTDSLRGHIARLGEQAGGIGRIMNVISDIADQTNLLALNAAIEAARAGDAGRGFAVVADEVRKLAEKTMTATKEVGSAINAIQTGARDTASGMDEAAVAVDEATQLASSSGEALRGIVDLSRGASDRVRSIATAAEEQSAASEQINRSVDEVNQVADRTVSGMGRSVDAVSRLSDQADELGKLIRDMNSA